MIERSPALDKGIVEEQQYADLAKTLVFWVIGKLFLIDISQD
jgi:hypothetical protein